jgi:hypothetical protein
MPTQGPAALEPATVSAFDSLGKIAEVDERFQSYNVEMVEVTGGRFWAPYGGPEGEVYRMRGPFDLSNQRLRNLAKALAPAYMRVSGTWANSTYLLAEGETLTEPPEGFNQILTRDQWRGLVDFSNAVNAPITTSMAVSAGTRDANGVWTTTQAQRLAELTREAGGKIAAIEYINEPNAAAQGRLPDNYDVDDYVRDFEIFADWIATAFPDALVAGPGGVGESRLESIPVAYQDKVRLRSEHILQRGTAALDVMSYHHYPTVSQRCQNTSRPPAAKEDALTPEWLDATIADYDYYSGLRDKYMPGKPSWITETAQAACGGSPWASSFLDTFRYVNQLGLLAQRGVDVVFHNTLAASDYSLIDEHTLQPNPNYWAAYLWNRLMGTTVLEAPASPSGDLRLYAQCLKGSSGGVAVAAVNFGESARNLSQLEGADAWVMTAQPLDSETVRVNGRVPAMDDDGSVSGLTSVSARADHTIPARSVAFYAVRNADNPACR